MTNIGEAVFSKIVLVSLGLLASGLAAYCVAANNAIVSKVVARSQPVVDINNVIDGMKSSAAAADKNATVTNLNAATAIASAKTANDKVDQVIAAQSAAAQIQTRILDTLKAQGETYRRQAETLAAASKDTAVAIGRMDEHLTAIDKRVDRIETREDRLH